MKNLVVICVIAALTAPAMAEGLPLSKADKSPPAKTLPRRGANNPCAEFGPGFVMIEGSSSCVKIGGSVSVGTGGSAAR